MFSVWCKWEDDEKSGLSGKGEIPGERVNLLEKVAGGDCKLPLAEGTLGFPMVSEAWDGLLIVILSAGPVSLSPSMVFIFGSILRWKTSSTVVGRICKELSLG